MFLRVVASFLVVALNGAGAFASDPPQRTLTFEERVNAQAAIERVYYAHQIGATKPFDQAVPRAVLENKVRKYLEQTVALQTYWKTAVTDETLQRELERMAQGTRMPERLQELYAALGNDAFLIKECLARPALVDRLAHNFYAFDPTMHVSADFFRLCGANARPTRADDSHSELLRHEPRNSLIDRFCPQFFELRALSFRLENSALQPCWPRRISPTNLRRCRALRLALFRGAAPDGFEQSLQSELAVAHLRTDQAVVCPQDTQGDQRSDDQHDVDGVHNSPRAATANNFSFATLD